MSGSTFFVSHALSYVEPCIININVFFVMNDFVDMSSDICHRLYRETTYDKLVV